MYKGKLPLKRSIRLFSILNMNNQEIVELNKITETVDFKWVTGNHDKKLLSKDKIGGKFFNSFQDND